MDRAAVASERTSKPPSKSAVPNRTPPNEFVARINAAWRASVQSIIEAGRLLIEAKAQIEPGHFQEMLRELPFSPTTARKLMSVARHPILTTNVELLPPYWRVLYELSIVPDNVLRAKIADGSLTPKITARDIAEMRGEVVKRKPSAKPIEDCLAFVRGRIEAIGAARRGELIGRLRALLDQLEALGQGVDGNAAPITCPAAV
jgi:hypothetical protein